MPDAVPGAQSHGVANPKGFEELKFAKDSGDRIQRSRTAASQISFADARDSFESFDSHEPRMQKIL